jgi:hypothetical protein
MRLRGALAALALVRAAAGATHADATRASASHSQHAQPAPLRAHAPATPPPPLPVLLQNLLPEGSVCANKTGALFYARGRDAACPCDCLGCHCRHAHARTHARTLFPTR